MPIEEILQILTDFLDVPGIGEAMVGDAHQNDVLVLVDGYKATGHELPFSSDHTSCSGCRWTFPTTQNRSRPLL